MPSGDFLYSCEYRTVIARSFRNPSRKGSGQAQQSQQKQLGTGSAIFRNEIATPFGLAMTIILVILICDAGFIYLCVLCGKK